MEIPKCESCGRIGQYKCAIDEKYVCCQCARLVPVSKSHLAKPSRLKAEIKVLDKMKQNSNDRTMFEAIQEITDCPPPEDIKFEEWEPKSGYAYGHKAYSVKTMAVYVDGQHAGYLDFMFTIDPEEEMSIQFWETAVHPKFQGSGLFSAMMEKLKQTAKENNVKRLYVSVENDNLPAIIVNYALGGKILYTREDYKGKKARFGVPRRNDLIFVYELGKD